jgi:type IV secretion system protein TrbI
MTDHRDDSRSPGERAPGAFSDRRVAPRGVLPRHIQMWVMVGVALVIVGIILVTGHPEPVTKTAAGRPAQPNLVSPDRIRSYEQALAAELTRQQEELARERQPTDAPAALKTAGEEAKPADPLEDERRQREYHSLFADNVALSRRQPDRATGQQAPTNPSTAAVPAPAGDSAPRDAGAGDQARAAAASQRAAEFRLLEGTVVETVLLNRIDGTFTGPVNCLVTTPVYSEDRQTIVIPAGARVLGSAAQVQNWGDSRLAVTFHRLVMPDGRTFSLDRFKGLDAIGDTGLKDTVDRHYWQVFGASLAVGALSGLSQFGSRTSLESTSYGDSYRQSAGASLATSSGRILDRYLNVLPTITVHEGYRIKVYLTNDLVLPGYQRVQGGA